MELQLILHVTLGGVVLAPNHLTLGEQSRQDFGWPNFPSRTRLRLDWAPLLDPTSLHRLPMQDLFVFFLGTIKLINCELK